MRTFNHPRLGRLRVCAEHGRLWFVAQDVCDSLGLRCSVCETRFLDARDKRDASISEYGLHTLLYRTGKRKTADYRRWLDSEVFPALRGGFPNNYADALCALAEEIRAHERTRGASLREFSL